MSDTDEFETDLTEAFTTEYAVSEDVATDAAAKVAAFREDWQEDLTADEFLELVETAPYDDFDHRFDRAIGALADEHEDCTDSREYRLSGFDDLAADPEMGA